MAGEKGDAAEPGLEAGAAAVAALSESTSKKKKENKVKKDVQPKTPSLTEAQMKKMKVADLKKQLKKRKLDQKGKKAVLLARLRA